MSKTQIIDFLEKEGKVSKEDADKLRVQLSSGTKSERDILLETHLVDEVAIAKATGKIFNMPFVDLSGRSIPDHVLADVDGSMLKKYNAIPFERNGKQVSVAMSNPFDIQAIEALRTKYPLGTHIKIYIATQKGIELQMQRKLGDVISSEVSSALEDVEPTVESISEDDTDDLDVNLQNAPVSRIVNSILRFATKVNASDVHIEPLEKRLRVRFRVNGVMSEKLSLPKNLTSAIVSRIKILSDIPIDEKRIPQDGRFLIKVEDVPIDLRVSTLPTIYGEKVVMRLLESGVGVPALETTGLRGVAYKQYIEATRATNGIILITGPTGSGKTRTLAGTLARLNTRKVNIITLENPVEIRIPGVNQVQINEAAGLTFAKGLRSILRQDPDIIMVGEIRDEATAKLAVEASLTGHLVLATLHTNSAAAAIPRLLEMGIEPYLLAATLRLVAAQRLPRRICSYCREVYPATGTQKKEILEYLSSIKDFDLFAYAQRMCKIKDVSVPGAPVPNMKCPERDSNGNETVYLYRGKGCDRCNGTGYSGRIGIFEVLNVNDKIGQLMMEGASSAQVNKTGVKAGMISMVQDGVLKAIEGLTTVEDVLRVSRN